MTTRPRVDRRVDSHTVALISASAFSEAVKPRQIERLGALIALLPSYPDRYLEAPPPASALRIASRHRYVAAIARNRSYDPEARASRSQHDGAHEPPLRIRGAAGSIDSVASQRPGGWAT